MSKTDKELMTEYGVISERVSVYHYKESQYSKLQDTVIYARLYPDENPVSHYSEPEKKSSSTGIGKID